MHLNSLPGLVAPNALRGHHGGSITLGDTLGGDFWSNHHSLVPKGGPHSGGDPDGSSVPSPCPPQLQRSVVASGEKQQKAEYRISKR